MQEGRRLSCRTPQFCRGIIGSGSGAGVDDDDRCEGEST